MVQGKGAEKMKQNIHPEYHKVIFLDTTTDFKFLSGSTKSSSETMEWEDGNEYPVIRLDISSDSHPFYRTSKIRCCGWSWNVSTRNSDSNQATNNCCHKAFSFYENAFYLTWTMCRFKQNCTVV